MTQISDAELPPAAYLRRRDGRSRRTEGTTRRVFRLALCGLLLGSCGCYEERESSVGVVAEDSSSKVYSKGGQRIAGYTDITGRHHEYWGHVKLRTDGSLEFSPASPPRRMKKSARAVKFSLSRDSVQMLKVLNVNTTRTTLGVIGSALLFGALLAKESCPFIYAWDGEQWVLEGDPYGGAITRSLERADWCELEHLVAVEGEYRLLLTNEVDETQHTNSLELLVVDHPPGTTLVMDRQGGTHAFRSSGSLLSARDEQGRDLTHWLNRTDDVVWTADLTKAARQEAVTDTRNHLTLRFLRPAGAERVFLISHISTGFWGSHMIRRMLELRGDRVGEFYAWVDSSESNRQQLMAWNAREELFELFPEVRSGDRWQRQDMIPGAGPMVSETRALALDLSGVVGDTVEIRLHPPVGFWYLNSFQLGWDEAGATVTRVAPRAARGAAGAEVVRALARADDRYLDFPSKGDRAELAYDAPPARAGMTRTVFAEARGWYELHLSADQPADLAALEKLTWEPGYIVRRALREYAEFERTGVLSKAGADRERRN